jgi:hypothetical protein
MPALPPRCSGLAAEEKGRTQEHHAAVVDAARIDVTMTTDRGNTELLDKGSWKLTMLR